LLGHAFPREARLRTRSDFRRVLSKGLRIHTRHFILYVLSTTDETCRLGVTVSRKVGNAVVRNRIKRCVREAFRLELRSGEQPYDLVVIAKNPKAGTAKQKTCTLVKKYTLNLVTEELNYGIRRYLSTVS